MTLRHLALSLALATLATAPTLGAGAPTTPPPATPEKSPAAPAQPAATKPAGEEASATKATSATAVPAARPAPDKPADPLDHLKYRLLGPAWGGRVARVAGVPGNPLIDYAASASGGVWKSEDGGTVWKSIFDDQPISSIGSIAVAPSDPNVVYVGSGEANIRGNVAAGNGIYKSEDAGRTWKHVWTQEGQIGTMAVDSGDADIAFAAVLGHAFGPNPERGVYRTRDGGRSWQQVLKKDADTGACDVALDPSNSRIVFAGLWQARRRPWELTSGGPGSGLYVSRDGGDTWKELTGKGLPEKPWGKIGVAVARSNGRRVYALIEAGEGGLFRSDDGGDTWTRTTGNRQLRQRAWYYSTFAINPQNPDEIWFPQVPLLKSVDGGKTLQEVHGEHHGDNHDVWIDPEDPKRILVGNDGGVDLSFNGGESWLAPPLPLGQCYHIAVDTSTPFQVACALQDIGTAQAPVDALTRAGIRNSDWHEVGGGEAGWVQSDPSDPNIVYAGEYGGYISRYDHRTGSTRNVSAFPDNPSGHGGEDLLYRFQWTAPIALSPHDPRVLYHGGNVLFRTTDGGQSWAPISPDLTRNDKSKQKWSGGPITGDNTGVEIYDTIFVVAESPAQKDLLWTGSDDGLVQVTRDGGKTWKDVTAVISGLPAWATISMIEPSRFDAGAAYVTADAHRLDDTHPYVWKTSDFGASWKRLDGGLAKDVYLHTVREDPQRRGFLYLGTERGVQFSGDDGATWQPLKLNLPTVAVHDLAIKNDSLVLATHGRSMWILDDLAPVREMTPAARAEAAHLFAPSPAIRWEIRGAFSRIWSAENPTPGARFYYWLKEAPAGDLLAEILDSRGQVIRTLSSKQRDLTGSSEYVHDEEEFWKKQTLPKEAGLNLGVWDLTYEGAEMIPGGKLDAGFPAVGPTALPGNYSIRLSVEGQRVTAPLQLLPDARVKVAAADLETQFRFALEVRAALTRLTRTVGRLHTVRQQLVARNDLLKEQAHADALRQGSSALLAKLEDLEGRIQNPKAEVIYDILAQRGGSRLYSRLAPLFDAVKEGNGAPTQGMREQFARHQTELEGYVGELERLISGDLARLNEQARSLGLPTIWAPPA